MWRISGLTFFVFHLLVGFWSSVLFFEIWHLFVFLLHWRVLFFFGRLLLWFRRWKIKYGFGLLLDESQCGYDLIKCVGWVLMEFFGCSVGFDFVHEVLGGLMFTLDHSLLFVGEMRDFTGSLLDMLGDLVELGIIDLKLTVIEVSLFYWIADLLELIQF